MRLTDQELDGLEAKILKAEDIVTWAAMVECAEIKHEVFKQGLNLIQMARELNVQSRPDAEIDRRSNDAAMFDLDMPPFVRAFLAMNLLSAMWSMPIREAGFMPKLYGYHDGKPVRVVMVSRFGDIGISSKDQEFGYYTRCSIYDVSGYTMESPFK